jgi:hypothetical protein
MVLCYLSFSASITSSQAPSLTTCAIFLFGSSDDK